MTTTVAMVTTIDAAIQTMGLRCQGIEFLFKDLPVFLLVVFFGEGPRLLKEVGLLRFLGGLAGLWPGARAPVESSLAAPDGGWFGAEARAGFVFGRPVTAPSSHSKSGRMSIDRSDPA
ncbi:MAG: hypothetical protein HUU21_30380 [Polyangiaceae bacterium]|nr:hypothetical protein [Polyangiaceae bacterium]